MKRILCLLTGLILLPFISLQIIPQINVIAATEPAIPVVIALSSIGTQEQLQKRVDEVCKRGFTASVNADPDIVKDTYLAELAKCGFEIMGTVPWQENDTYEQQLKETVALKGRLEAATGQAVVGFSPDGSRFNRGNKNTYPVLGAIGATYILQSARYEKMPGNALEPYRLPGYNFYCVPMQSRGLYNAGVDEYDQTVLAMSGSN
jgi:hypothetical protein